MIKNLPNLKQVLAALLTIAALATGQTAWAWDGSGTSDSPWLIKTTDDLVALANNSASNTYYGKFFRLENDLDMNGVAIGTIGGNIKRFKGTFDGNGHAIRNLTINKPDDDYVGLFGIISANSTIRNLIIDGANITGNNNVGVIFGCTFDGGTIENCLVVNSSVTVTSSTGTYGGIISGCYLDNLTFSGNYYYNCSVTMGSNAPVTTNIATTGGDIDGAAIAVGPATWAALQTAFNNASTDADNPTELTLAADITASASDSYLNLTGGRKVILDLNGHTLSRGLTAATTDGYVIRVIGTNTSLTIRDGATGGTITGGWSNSGPGCISVTNNATLRLESGTISGNRVNRSGGTISITGGTVYITGGTITGNWANIETWNNNSFASCGAIYFNEGGTLYMSGGAITGNRCRTTTLGAAGIGASLMLSHRVHLSGSYNISGNEQGDYDEATGEWSNLTPSDILNNNRTLYILDGPINPVAPAHMILDHDGSSATFTSGWATHMGSTDPEQCFTLDPATGKGLGIVDGEVHVGTLHTLTLADGLTASVTQAAQGKSVTLSGASVGTIGGITYTTDYIVSYNDGTNDHVDHYTADDQGNATFVMPDANVTVSTETVASVTYIDADGNEQTITDFTIVSSSYEFGDDIGTGTALLGVDDYTERWYAVVGTVSLDKRLSVEGNARLILCDAAALIVNADYDCGTAFDVTYNGLTIYGQAQGTGTLSVTNTGTAIGTHDITVNGGTVIATSTDIFFYGIDIFNGRTLTINRGTVTASGGNGISINRGTLTQNGGTLSATGAYGISIDEGTLTLNGGTLNATGSGTNYAGIYATYYDATVNILGGTLNATGTADAYGIYATGDGTTVTLGWTTPDDRITASSIQLESGATLQVRDGQTLTNEADNTAIISGTLSSEQIAALAGVTLRGCMVREVVGYGESTTSGWNLIASPIEGSIAADAVGNIFSAAQYDLYRFNQAAELEWENWKSQANNNDHYHFNLESGRGYLYASKANTTLVFTGEFYDGDGIVNLEYSTQNQDVNMRGWNLIGNPFAETANLPSGLSYYTLNDTRSELIAGNASTIGAMEAIFVKATGTGQSVQFTKQSRGGVSTLRQAQGSTTADNAVLSLNLTDNHNRLIDRAIVRFDEGQPLPKFQIRETSTKVYIPQEGKDYAIVSVGNMGEIPLNFKANENGTYTITVNVDNVEMAYLHLIDNMTGADVDLLVPELVEGPASYTFTAKTTDYESRFKLVFSADEDVCEPNEAFAFISNGNIIVNGEGTLQVFDILGHQLITKQLSTLNSKLSTLNYKSGVYVLRLINGENVRTQKIVIE